MPNNNPVYCQILGSAIPTSLCFEEQGQRECRGCDSKCRNCTACKNQLSTNPKFGLCDDCLAAAIEKDCCQECRRQKRRGKRNPYCTSCYNRLIKAGSIEPIMARGRGKSSNEPEGSAADLLDKVWFFVEDPTKRGDVPWTEDNLEQERIEAERLEGVEAELEFTFEQLVSAVCEVFKVSSEDLLGKTRAQPAAFARQVMMFMLREMEWSFPKIGKILGRHHTTVMHAVSAIAERIESDSQLQKDVEMIKSRLRLIQGGKSKTEISKPEPQGESQEETDGERRKRLMSDPDYYRWYYKVSMKDAKRTARAYEPMVFKPTPRVWCSRCQNHPAEQDVGRCKSCLRYNHPISGFLPTHLPPSMTHQEEWVALLQEDCWDAVTIGGQDVQLVMHYREATYLDPISLDQFEQDDRIVLLNSKRGRYKKAKHCLVFESDYEARSFIAQYYDDRLFCMGAK